MTKSTKSDISDKDLDTVLQMADEGKSDDEIIKWIESQESSEQIFDFFNTVIQGYSVKHDENNENL
jgi:hypothetical protein